MRVFPGLALYGVLSVLIVVDLVWLSVAGIGVDFAAARTSLLATAALAVAAFALRMISAGRGKGIVMRGHVLVRPGLVDGAVDTAEACFFLLCGWNALRVLNHLTMTTALPFADDLLAGWDAALGLDWNAYFAFVAARPVLIFVLAMSYVALNVVSVLGLLGLMALGRTRAAEFFVVTFFVTAILCIVAGMFFPAEAAVAHLLDQPELLAAFRIEPGLYHLEQLNLLREGGTIVFNLDDMPGLVTFPSFHTAGGVVVAWCYRRTVLFWPVLLYALALIASTPIFGGHYFVDLIAGTAVALAVLVVAGRMKRYRGLFAAPRVAQTVVQPA